MFRVLVRPWWRFRGSREKCVVSESIMNATQRFASDFIPFTHVIALLAFDKLICVLPPWLVIRTSSWPLFKPRDRLPDRRVLKAGAARHGERRATELSPGGRRPRPPRRSAASRPAAAAAACSSRVAQHTRPCQQQMDLCRDTDLHHAYVSQHVNMYNHKYLQLD